MKTAVIPPKPRIRRLARTVLALAVATTLSSVPAAGQTQLFELTASDGIPLDQFGTSVAIDGTNILVGVEWDKYDGYPRGSVYLFDLVTGQELFKLYPPDGAPGDLFGWSVSLDGDRALIGAHQHDEQGEDSGSAYLFDVTTGALLYELVPGLLEMGYNFGLSVSLRGRLAVVGAPFDQGVVWGTGYTYLFDADSGEEISRLLGSGLAFGDSFGYSVAAGDYGIVAGAPDHGSFQGVAYVFDTGQVGNSYCSGDALSGTPCPCANENDGSVPGAGCSNGVFLSGALLSGEGTPSVGEDTLVLTTTGLVPHEAGLYFQGVNAIDGGDGVWFGDGLRCAGGALIRLQVRIADGTGVSSTTISLAEKGGGVPGDVRYYQCWYRDTSGMQPCGPGVHDFNLSNGFEILWRP